MPITHLHSKEQMDEYKKKLNQLRTRGSWEGEIGHIRKDGTAFFTYVSFTLLKNNEGKPTRTLAIARDITGIKRREEELSISIYSEKMARAEQLASLGTLSATVAHELTQPLTVLRLLIENILTKLEATSSPETVTSRLKDSLTEVSNITSIVDRFRNYARRSSEEIVKEIELEAVAEKIVKLLNESARRAKIALCLNDVDKLPPVYSNERDMEQLFFALTVNAIQAADGKKSRQLIINGAVKNEHIELGFSDDCGGIAPDNIDKVFEPFFTTKPKGQGTGLGLCIVQSIVSRAGGKIRVESKFGEGSTFFVTLPIKESTWS
jgi:C4-dicarboxylate-specific signal transduction histidine kinase